MFDQLRCSLSKPTRAGLVGDIASLLRTVSDASVIAVPGFINFLVFDLIRDPACAPLALQMLGDIILHRPSLECDVSLLGVPSFVGVAGLVGPSRPIHADIVMKLIEWSAGAVLPAITSCLLRGVVHETFLTYCTYLVLTLLSATIPAPDHHVRPLTLALLHALDHALQPPKVIQHFVPFGAFWAFSFERPVVSRDKSRSHLGSIDKCY
uniref:Uncharacterized protein n=1 Tax=Spongospora subterranea TaxID=70186 RepID=A0A0H5R7A5_9EUKA|eukprot:CRZ04174.1 hypothetical protein [Spongospora subterranea]